MSSEHYQEMSFNYHQTVKFYQCNDSLEILGNMDILELIYNFLTSNDIKKLTAINSTFKNTIDNLLHELYKVDSETYLDNICTNCDKFSSDFLEQTKDTQFQTICKKCNQNKYENVKDKVCKECKREFLYYCEGCHCYVGKVERMRCVLPCQTFFPCCWGPVCHLQFFAICERCKMSHFSKYPTK